MDKLEKPCFDYLRDNLYEESWVGICTLGKIALGQCAHIREGGTWKDCKSGGLSKHLKDYKRT